MRLIFNADFDFFFLFFFVTFCEIHVKEIQLLLVNLLCFYFSSLFVENLDILKKNKNKKNKKTFKP